MRLSALERNILNRLQEEIPLESNPFEIISKLLGMKEEKLLKIARRLKKRGPIRNFAAHLDHRKLGFRSTLIALRIPSNKIESIAKDVIIYPEVTHCYSRKGEYNLWLVFISREKKGLKKFVDRLASHVGRENILNLITKKQFKLKTALRV